MYIPLSWFLQIILHEKELGQFAETTDFKASTEKLQEDELGTSHHVRK